LLMDVLRDDTIKVPVIEHQIYMCSACRHIARRLVFRRTQMPITHLPVGMSALALDRKKLAAFSALGGGFLLFPIGDRRCNRTRASVGNAGGNARPSLTNATLAASRLLHRRSPTAPCSKGALAAHRKKLAAFSALGGRFLHDFSLFF